IILHNQLKLYISYIMRSIRSSKLILNISVMMNNFSFLLIVITLLAFSSCMQDHPNELDIKKEVQINAFITSSSTNIATRASDQTWDAGDAVGVFMKKATISLSNSALAENAKYVADGSLLFQPATEDDKIYFP